MKVNPNVEYACYRLKDDDGRVYHDGVGPPWKAIDMVVDRSLEDGWYVTFEFWDFFCGEYRECSVGSLISREDLLKLFNDDKLTPDGVVRLINERHRKQFTETEHADHAEAFLLRGEESLATAKAELTAIVGTSPCEQGELNTVLDRLVEWSIKHIKLYPRVFCPGIHPFPIGFFDGEWHFGYDKRETPPDITISCQIYAKNYYYAEWTWKTIQGDTGKTRSLVDAVNEATARFKEAGNESKP